MKKTILIIIALITSIVIVYGVTNWSDTKNTADETYQELKPKAK